MRFPTYEPTPSYHAPRLRDVDQDLSEAIANRQEAQELLDTYGGGGQGCFLKIPRRTVTAGFPFDRPLYMRGNSTIAGESYSASVLTGKFFAGPVILMSAERSAFPTSTALEPDADFALKFEYEPANPKYFNLSHIGFNPHNRSTIGLEIHLYRRSAPEVGAANSIIGIGGRILADHTEAFTLGRAANKFQLKFRTEDGSATLTSTTSIAASTAYEVAVSYDKDAGADNLILLIDGVVEDTATLTGKSNPYWYETATIGGQFSWMDGEGLLAIEDWDVGSFRWTADARRTANYTPSGLAYSQINDCLCGWDGTTDPDLPVDTIRFFSGGRYGYLQRNAHGSEDALLTDNNRVQDLTLFGNGEGTSVGVQAYSALRSQVERVWLSGMGPYGIHLGTSSFESLIRDIPYLGGYGESLANARSLAGCVISGASGVTVVNNFQAIQGWQCGAALSGGLSGGFLYANQITQVGFYYQAVEGVLRTMGVAEEDTPYQMEWAHLINQTGGNNAMQLDLHVVSAEIATAGENRIPKPIGFYGGFNPDDRTTIHCGQIAPNADITEIVEILDTERFIPGTLQFGPGFTWRNKSTVPLSTTPGVIFYDGRPWREYSGTILNDTPVEDPLLLIPIKEDSITKIRIAASGVDQVSGHRAEFEAVYRYERYLDSDAELIGDEPDPLFDEDPSGDWDITRTVDGDKVQIGIVSDPDNPVIWQVQVYTDIRPRNTGDAPDVAIGDILEGSQYLYFNATQVTEASGVISEARDLGSEGFDATQADSSKRPLLVEDWQNGRPAMAFDGVNDIIQGSGTIINNGNGWGLFIVGAKDNDPDSVSRNDPWCTGAGTGAASTMKVGGNKYVMTSVANTTTDGPFGCGTDPGYFSWNCATETGTPECRVNGVDLTGESGARPNGGDITGFSIGGIPGQNLQGKIAAFILKNGAFTGPELAALEAWAVSYYDL